ncbi:xyloglucan O-acetyltransferase 4-like [Magnolia sinica]|uniref:xyloglucan O-acetyltransferase 4-like n=1 Tax=Magnolia sinica TaxID=86752 RepID=UPI00265A0C22|nr:xyloglucan O-acetyltransferase 4-like [Magnolia sinica]
MITLSTISQVEMPVDVYKDANDRFRTWYFPSHDFTLRTLWTKFLVVGTQRVINGSASSVFDIHVDKIDMQWAEKLHEIDYAIISDGHWFFRKMYLYEGDKLIGCVFCTDTNVTNVGLSFAIRRAFQTALKFVNGCNECRDLITLIRTFSPAHFEHGTWNDGGRCNRTMPLSEGKVNLGGTEWEVRNVQVEEVERAMMNGWKRYRVLDVTKAMLMRADGHPGSHWNNNGMDGYNDCVHWCLPGPIDAWNDLLLGVLKKEPSLH